MRTKRTLRWFPPHPTATLVQCSSLSSSIHCQSNTIASFALSSQRSISRYPTTSDHVATYSFVSVPGFSLDSGSSLTKKGQLTVVAGAPRANHSGSVVLLKKGDDTTKILLEEFTLEGEGLASSFGYDVAVLDLNADG